MEKKRTIFPKKSDIIYNDREIVIRHLMLAPLFFRKAVQKCAAFWRSKAKRKVTKVHQNVLVFYKGDIKGIEPETNVFTWEDLREGEGNVDPETGKILPKFRDQENVAEGGIY